MSCEACRDRLVMLLHDELGPDEAREVAAHVRGCDPCAVEYCRMHLDLVGVIEAHAIEPPPRVHAALREAVARRFAPRPWRRMLATLRHPVPAYGLALAAIVPLAIWLAQPSRPHGEMPAIVEASAPIEAPPVPRASRPELSDYDGATFAPVQPIWM